MTCVRKDIKIQRKKLNFYLYINSFAENVSVVKKDVLYNSKGFYKRFTNQYIKYLKMLTTLAFVVFKYISKYSYMK